MGSVTGPHARSPRTHSQWVVGPGRTPQRTGRWGWESARLRPPHTQARGAPPRAPPCRPNSGHTQLARVRAVGSVTGAHAHNLRTHSQLVVGPGRTPERTGGPGWESAQPRRPHTQARGAPPPGHPCAAPTSVQSQLARTRAVGLLRGAQAHSPCTHSQWVVGPGRTPQRTGGRRWESALAQTPKTQARGAPPGRPSAAPTARKASFARARAVGLVTGPHAHQPRTHSQWVVGPGRTPQRTGSRVRESALLRPPHTQARGALPPRPHAVPTARKASWQERALWGW